VKSYGITGTATTCDRPIPHPTRPAGREEDHITARLERVRTFTSPIVLHNPEEFTPAQLTAAGFTLASGKPKRKPRPPVTSTTDATRIVSLYRDGANVEEVAATVGVSTATVRRYLDAANVPRRPTTRRPTQDVTVDPDTLRELYTVEGLYQAQIAARLGVPLRTVERALANAGLGREDRASVPRPHPVKTLMDANGITAGDIRKWARRQGYKCPDRGNPPKHLVESFLLTRALSTTQPMEGTA
jgi:transposase